MVYERIGSDMIALAKRVDLREYLKDKYPELITYDEKSKQYSAKDDSDVIIGAEGFYNFNTRYQGDQIQFLEDFDGLTFKEAVTDLHIYAKTNEDKLLEASTDKTHMFSPPPRSNEKYKCVWAYLVYKRKIPHKIVESLFDEKTLYQSRDYNNCVFVSKQCDFAEINGTSDNRFKKLAKDSDSDGYWITGDPEAETCYICKSAIEAISLKALHQKYMPEITDVCYTSISGYNKDAIKRIKDEGYKNLILAFPYNDETLGLCHKFELNHIFASCDSGANLNDWNDILVRCDDEKIIKNLLEDIVAHDCPF